VLGADLHVEFDPAIWVDDGKGAEGEEERPEGKGDLNFKQLLEFFNRFGRSRDSSEPGKAESGENAGVLPPQFPICFGREHCQASPSTDVAGSFLWRSILQDPSYKIIDARWGNYAGGAEKLEYALKTMGRWNLMSYQLYTQLTEEVTRSSFIEMDSLDNSGKLPGQMTSPVD
jgi:hypothetical protein